MRYNAAHHDCIDTSPSALAAGVFNNPIQIHQNE